MFPAPTIRAVRLLLSALPFLFAAFSFAQGGPPLITDDPYTVETRHWEINTALTTEHRDNEIVWEAPLADINYGLNRRTQLKLEFPWLLRTSAAAPLQRELGSARIGMRYRFVDEEKHHVAISTYPQFTFETTSTPHHIADPGSELFLPLEIAHQFKRFELNGEVGYNLRRFLPNQWSIGGVMGYQVNHRVELLAELHEVGAKRFSDSELVANGGARVTLSKHWVLLLSAGHGLLPARSGGPGFISYTGLQLRL